MLLSLVLPLLLAASQSGSPTHLDLPTGLPNSFSVRARMSGVVVHLDLTRRSLRADGFLVQTSAGLLAAEDIPEPVTYFGSLRGMPDVQIIASLRPEGLTARIQFPEKRDSWWRITPNQKRGQGWHFIQEEVADFPESCGSETIETPAGVATITPPGLPSKSSVGAPTGGKHFGSPNGANRWVVREAQIAYDADFCYYEREGSTIAGTIAGVEQQLAEMELCYAQDAQITYELTAIVIRDQPYYPTFTSAGDGLTKFYQEWDANQTHIPRDTAYFLTDYCNDGIAGLAYLGTLGGWSYGETVWDRGHSPGIMAHEVGHNWGAGHIDCWPWGGSAMCGAWLLLGPDTSDIARARADWLNLPMQPAYPIAARPYADPDYAETDCLSSVAIDVLANDHDANLHPISIDSFDTNSGFYNGSITLSPATGPFGRDELIYTPDPTRNQNYEDTFWYTNIDESGLTHDTPVTVTVRSYNVVARWQFDEGSGANSTDTSGKQNDATIGRVPVFTQIPSPVITASATAYSSTYLADNLLDNDAQTEYASDEQGPVSFFLTTDPYHGTWIEFDFGAPVDIDGFRHYDRAASIDKTAASRLIFSQDATFDSQDPVVLISHISSDTGENYPFERQTARFVRWEITEALDWYGSYSLGGKEIAFLQEQNYTVLPAPTVTASTDSINGYPSTQLFDGDSATQFIARGSGETTNTYSQVTTHGTWVEADFGQVVSIDAISFLDRTASNAWTGRSRLTLSHDVYFNSGDDEVILDHYDHAVETTYDFPPMSGRYVRWEVIEKEDASSFSKQLGGSEMTFLGDGSAFPGFDWVNSPSGTAVAFDGSGASARNRALQDSVSQSDDPWSFCVRYLINQTPADGTLVAGLGSPEASVYENRFFQGTASGNVGFGDVETSLPWRLGSWTLLTITYDGKRIRLYENGQFIEKFPMLFLESAATEMWLCGLTPSQSESFSGALDETQLWDYRLTDAQVLGVAWGGQATGPSPQNDARTQPTNSQLSWSPGFNNPTHHVYLGTSHGAVSAATQASPEYLGSATSPSFDPGLLGDLTTYYWRIDEEHSAGTLPGMIWAFDTERSWSTIIYDGFEDGGDNVSLDLLDGGLGFNYEWNASGSGFKHRTGSIGALPSNVPLTEAPGYFEAPQNQVNSNREATRIWDGQLVDVDLGGDGVYYISFAVKSSGNGLTPTALVGLTGSNNSESIMLGVRDGMWSVEGAAGSGAGYSFGRNTPWFVVARLDCHASGIEPDTIRFKFYNATSDSVHASDSQLNGQGIGANNWTVISTGQSSMLHPTQLKIVAGAESTAFSSFVQIDEIRIGRSWTDVTGL
ncbi:MAG: hypothetical protein HOM34_08735 [Planctomycetes bacterium]|nr:hypothetical protein [Planctomycetota bacterium]MBT4029178.1 hypothetical protein [Planctomycetota bacterium]MBT4559259.1 hypothetical protein [Planctomycetota bacterium]MBT5101977.1 hypothetical protein [Planctomycetota bacterium]MBT5120792.1 hypothetical protein [Planctomycetota bacterium]